jgi:uncharacterized protein YcbK (DUF882 family)
MNHSGISHSCALLVRLALLITISLIIFSPSPGMSIQDSNRFFLKGDGKINIRNEHTKREARVILLDSDGMLNEKALNEIDAVFIFSDKRKGEHISLRLLFLLDYFSDKIAPGQMIHLISGYRSPAYNQKLKKRGGNVARTSAHMDALALDFYLEGVNGKVIWETVRQENCCGIGHYGGASVHLDAGKPRFWEAATSKTRTRESEFNRKIYLSTEYDRYRKGEKIRFFLTSLSNFPFGIQRTASLFKDINGKNDSTALTIQARGKDECILINDRAAARSIHATLPAELEQGRYRVRLDFCKRPFEQMPSATESNEIEIVDE